MEGRTRRLAGRKPKLESRGNHKSAKFRVAIFAFRVSIFVSQVPPARLTVEFDPESDFPDNRANRGAMVQRLARQSFKLQIRVRFPVALPGHAGRGVPASGPSLPLGISQAGSRFAHARSR